MLQRLLHSRLQRLHVSPGPLAYHQDREAVLSAAPLFVAHRRDPSVGRRVHVRLVPFELARNDEGKRLHVSVARQLENPRYLAAVDVAGLLGEHAETLQVKEKRRTDACRDGGGVLRERIQRRLHHLVVADIAVALARQIEHIGVRIEERKQRARRLIQRVVSERPAQIAQIPHLPLTLGRSVEARGDDSRMLAGPRHFGAFRSVMRTPFRDDAVIARVEETVHLIFGRYAEQIASIAPVKVLRKSLAITRHHLIA